MNKYRYLHRSPVWIVVLMVGVCGAGALFLRPNTVYAGYDDPFPNANVSHWTCDAREVVRCNTEQLLLNRSLDEALGYLIYWEVGLLVHDPDWWVVMEMMTRKFNQYCTADNPLSGRCVRSFWAYFSPMYIIQYRPDYLEQLATGIPHSWYYWGMTVRDNPQLGGQTGDRPAHWMTMTRRYNPQTLEQWLQSPPNLFYYRTFRAYGETTVFAVLSPNQMWTLCGSTCMNMP